MAKRKREAKKVVNMMLKQAKQNNCQSVRPLFFTHCSKKIEDNEGMYHSDLVSIGGSGVVLRYKHTYFLLTALHVVKNYLDDNQQNDAPLTCMLKENQGEYLELGNTGFVNVKWNISELLPDKPGVDENDVVLLQLSDVHFTPDSFIDLDKKNSYRTYVFCPDREGNIALFSGYPARLNNITYPIYDDESYGIDVNCLAHLSRDHVPVALTSETTARTLEFKGHDNLNGMSGGLVTLVNEIELHQELVGLALTGGNGGISFYPMKELLTAVRAFQEASSEIVDPIANFFDSEIYFSEKAVRARKMMIERWGEKR